MDQTYSTTLLQAAPLTFGRLFHAGNFPKGLSMRSLLMHQRPTRLSNSPLKTRTPYRNPAGMPSLRSRPKTAWPAGSCGMQRANYYFDASHQTVKTLRKLLAEWREGTLRPGLQTPIDLLGMTMESLLTSICPAIEDDGESRSYFHALLCMHLSGLTATDLVQLRSALKTAQFTCYVVENIIDDAMYLEYGFSNGSPHSRSRTLMQSQEFYDVLDDLHQQAAEREAAYAPVSAISHSTVRAALSDCAARWSASARSLPDLTAAAQALAAALKVPLLWSATMAGVPASRASMLEGRGNILLIDPDVVTQLAHDSHGSLFAAVMRDLLELLLMQKLFGADHLSQSMAPAQRHRLQDALDQIIDCLPPCATVSQVAQARKVLAHPEHCGRVQIIPTKGTALGHAWIAPTLSLLPDTTREGVTKGTRFMHSGFQLQAGESTIREWPIRFASHTENNQLFPANAALHLPVPVDSLRLQMAADSIVKEWRERALPYRFTGTRPGEEATGCRITVWKAVQRGMDEDALALLRHYHCGLPEPESPTELWLRLDGMMRWLDQITSGAPEK
jgi:hypothetical protein